MAAARADKHDPNKLVSDNRQASHHFFLLDRYEAGLVLTGTEVKAAKNGKVQLREAWASVEDNEAWLQNAHFGEYDHGNRLTMPPFAPVSCFCTAGKLRNSAKPSRKKGSPWYQPGYT